MKTLDGMPPRPKALCQQRDVKDAHTHCNAGRAQNERHEVSRNMRKGSVVLGRRLPLKDEFSHTAIS
jgi:hypothetical protein